MMIKGSRKYNYHYNSQCKCPEIGEMINGQAVGDISKIRYGSFYMSFNGCEVIAVHNALIHINKPKSIVEIAFYMERFKVLFGLFGCNVYKIGRALEYFEIKFRRVKKLDDIKSFIVSFWNGRPLMSSIHTVFCIRTEKGIEIYNRYNNCPDIRCYETIDDIIGKRKMIVAYEIL